MKTKRFANPKCHARAKAKVRRRYELVGDGGVTINHSWLIAKSIETKKRRTFTSSKEATSSSLWSSWKTRKELTRFIRLEVKSSCSCWSSSRQLFFFVDFLWRLDCISIVIISQFDGRMRFRYLLTTFLLLSSSETKKQCDLTQMKVNYELRSQEMPILFVAISDLKKYEKGMVCSNKCSTRQQQQQQQQQQQELDILLCGPNLRGLSC